MNKNPECIECGLLKSTTEAVTSPLCSRAKLAGGSHNFGKVPPTLEQELRVEIDKMLSQVDMDELSDMLVGIFLSHLEAYKERVRAEIEKLVASDKVEPFLSNLGIAKNQAYKEVLILPILSPNKK